MSQLIVFLALVFSVVIAIFAVQNTAQETVRFLTFQIEGVAVSVLVLISAALGALAMLLLGIAREVPIRWRHRSVSQQLKQARARVAELEAAQTPPPPPPATPALTAGESAPEVKPSNAGASEAR